MFHQEVAGPAAVGYGQPLAHPANAELQHSAHGQSRVRVSLLGAVLTHSTLFVTVFLMYTYVFNWPNPVASNPSAVPPVVTADAWKFNWHPILMVSAFVIFMGEAIMAYRLFPFEHEVQKRWHVALQTVALVCASVGLYFIIDFHRLNDIPHFYNVHSILGLLCFCLFGVQYVVGLYSFCVPKLADRPRARLMPVHKYVGIVLFVGLWLTMIAGLMDRQRLQFHFPVDATAPALRTANVAGVFIALSGAAVLYHMSSAGREAGQRDGADVHTRLLP